MDGPATQRYLETEVLTAPAQKLQLMLIEAAIRSTQRAQRHLEEGRAEDACELLIRAQQIVTELLSGLNRDVDGPLAGKVAAVYLFVFRRLMEANVEQDAGKLSDVLRVLRIERETWAEVCRNVGTAPDVKEKNGRRISVDSRNPRQTPPPAALTRDEDLTGGASPGFSLEA